ncbi:MAG: hypothetical protein AAF533_04400 [Acidobacteriota bacterium]
MAAPVWSSVRWTHALLSTTLVLVSVSSATAGGRWWVEQADPSGDGSYNLLGCIEAHETGRTPELYYGYQDLPEPWYHGPSAPEAPLMVVDQSQLFMVEHADGDISVVVLHDRPDNPDGGWTVWRMNADPPIRRSVVDDPGFSDTYSPVGAGPHASHLMQQQYPDWSSDGAMFSGLTRDHEIIMEFVSFTGLRTWKATSADGHHLSLDLRPGLPVRITWAAPGLSCDPACDSLGFEGGDDADATADAVFPQAPITVIGSPGPAVLFDSSAPTCDDDDLVTPGTGTGNEVARGMVLVVKELGSDCARDDEREGGVIDVRYDEPRHFFSVGILDADEEGGLVRVLDLSGDLLCETEIPALDDNSWQEVRCESTGVYQVEVQLAGSGAVTDIDCRPSPTIVAIPDLPRGQVRVQAPDLSAGRDRPRAPVSDPRLRPDPRDRSSQLRQLGRP